LGHALNNAGQPRRTVEVVAPEALRIAHAFADEARASHVCQLALDGMFRMGTFAIAATPAYRQWAEQAGRYAAPGTPDRVRADAALAVVRRLAGQTRDAWDTGARALALARKLDDPETLVAAAFHLLAFEWPPHQDDIVRALAAELAERPRTGIRVGTLGFFLGPAGAKLLDAGERARAEALWQEASALEARTQDAYLRIVSLIVQSVLSTVDGHLSEAVAQGAQLLRRATELGMPRLGRAFAEGVSTRALIHLGRAEEALPAITVPWSRMLCLAHQGQHAAAREALVTFLAQNTGALEADDLAVNVLVCLLETAVLVEDRDAAAILVRPLRHCADRSTVGFALTCVARHLGAAEALLERPEEARADYRTALVVAERIRFRPEVALTRLQLAELLLAHYPDERAEAEAHVRFAIPELEAMKMAPALERARRLSDAVAE
jgi:tetratricopeptide (TPR) repeat protein